MGGNNGMQRSGGSVRTMMALCLGGLVLVTVLYLAKRVESNRTHRELDLVKMESRDITEGLNNKLMECIEKVESLTQESTVIGGELRNCKDSRANLLTQAQQMKGEHEKCERDLKISAEDQGAAEVALQQTTSDRDAAIIEKQTAESELQEIQEDNANIQSQFDECEADKERLNSQKDMEGRCNNQLVSAEEKLKEATDTETGLMSQIQALTSQKKSLEARISQLLEATNGGGGEQSHPQLQKPVSMRDHETQLETQQQAVEQFRRQPGSNQQEAADGTQERAQGDNQDEDPLLNGEAYLPRERNKV